MDKQAEQAGFSWPVLALALAAAGSGLVVLFRSYRLWQETSSLLRLDHLTTLMVITLVSAAGCCLLHFRRRTEAQLRRLAESEATLEQIRAELQSTREELSERKAEIVAINHSLREMEETLRWNQEFLTQILNAIADPIFVRDEQRRWLLLNDAFCLLVGRTREELSDSSDDEFLPGAEAAFSRESDQQVFATGQSNEYEETITDLQGRVRTVITRKTLFTDPSGQKVLVGIVRDITARKQAEDALRHSENRLRTIVSSLDEQVMETDAGGSVLNVWAGDHQFMARAGLGDARVNESESEQAHLSSAIRTVLESGQSASVEFRGSSRRWFHSRITPIPAADGSFQTVCVMSSDITERREAEEILQRRLAAFLEIASAVSEGDLTRRAAEDDDVLGLAVKAVNLMLNNFSAMLAEVRQIGLSVSTSATQILTASERIAGGSQRQADEITNISNAVEKMAASMKQVSKNAEASADAVRGAMQLAVRGDRSMHQTTAAMSRIESAVQLTSEKMRVLGARSSEISEIINLINEIAAQTNLLALNAAIEAAHAGQAGTGFSVVADEIRKLAERSSRATRDVGTLIKSIQKEISEAVSAMEKGSGEVQIGAQVSQEAGLALQEISTAVRHSVELMEEISTASEEQASITNNLARNMQVISGITIESSAVAHDTTQTLQGMVTLCEQLNGAISQFRVGDEAPFNFSVAGATGAGRQLRPRVAQRIRKQDSSEEGAR
jgi:twitching motility protein PilJ